MKLFDANGEMLPFRASDPFLWVTADQNVIHQRGETLTMVIPTGDDEYENAEAGIKAGDLDLTRGQRVFIGALLARAPAMFNFIMKLAKDGDEQAQALVGDLLIHATT
jgi:hypothetical protein